MTLSNYATEGAFNTYILHLAIKKHFTEEKYDFFKYNGKIRANFDSFRTRQDTYHYYKLSKIPHRQDIILSNVLVKPTLWIGEIKENTAYLSWKKLQDGLSYHFSEDLKKLKTDWKQNFEVVNGNNPFILQKFMQKEISLETMTICATIANVYDYWEKNVLDTMVASGIVTKSRKYSPFLQINENFKSLIKKHIKND